MPRLPRGMFKRGSCFYARLYQGGRERRKSLGPDFNRAVLQLHRLRAGVAVRDPQATVSSMGKTWLEMDVQHAAPRLESWRPKAAFIGSWTASWATWQSMRCDPMISGRTGSGSKARKPTSPSRCGTTWRTHGDSSTGSSTHATWTAAHSHEGSCRGCPNGARIG